MELLSQERAGGNKCETGGNKCETGQNEQDLVHAQVEHNRDETVRVREWKPVFTDDELGLHEVSHMDVKFQ